MRTAFVVILSTFALAGCSSNSLPPNVLAARDPANPSVGAIKAHHHGVIRNYSHRKPVVPEGWENPEGEPPAPGSGGGT